MDIHYVDPFLLVENPQNTNRHSVEQIARIAKIISYQGFREPISISNQTGLIVSGHARRLAAIELGLKAVPVIYQDFSSYEQEYAHLVACNEIARWAELDFQALCMETKGWDIDPDMFGLSSFKLRDDNDEKSGDDPDKVRCPTCGK